MFNICSPNTKNLVARALMLTLIGAASISGAAAREHKRVDPMAMRASAENFAQAPRRNCAPANGAQIIGGFAGAGDWLDADTGEICTPR